ncbi:MAG: V-type ATP synthase subunit I [Haloferacaceae archaeon]
MSKVSVTGSRRVLADVVELVYDRNLLHVTEYDDSWEGFAPGDPTGDAETSADRLVTARSLKSILGVSPEDAGPTRVLTDEEVASELADVRERVNELDDRRDEIESRIAEIDEALETVDPFVELGIDLDLLSGYDSLQVAVGEGSADGVERAVVDADDLREFEVFAESGVVAVFARPAPGADEGALSDALVGTDFAALEVPDASGDPSGYVSELESERQSLEAELASVEADLDALREEVGGFLLAAEEHLRVQVQKAEAPLSFATTENTFVAEGWIPSESYTGFKRDLTDAVDDRVEVEELERASFSADGSEALREELPGDGDAGAGRPAAADGGDGQARADGGTAASSPVVMRDDTPPVVQQNPGPASYFEAFVKAVGRPSYREFDPTIVLFLTFPAFFGFMIGDLGYGILYAAIGYVLYDRADSEVMKSMGGVTMFAGGFTALFGILYGEIFGFHLITQFLWEGALGLHGPPIEKGLSPNQISWAQSWLVLSLLVGVLHLNVGYAFDFLENLEFHGAKDALLESGSWMLMMNGLWVWVFSRSAAAVKPSFLYTVFDGSGTAPEATGEFAHAAFALGFNGFSPAVGLAGAAAFAVGLVLLAVGDFIEIVEFLQVLVNVLSYTRMAAVLLAKAGMAFTVNLLVFGAYVDPEGEFHFLLTHGPSYVAAEYGGEAELLFGGLVHGGVALVLVGLVVLLVGHLLVLALGVTSAGLQAVRLEYVEFFGKFFEGGGTPYSPFGTDRQYTADE